MERPTTSNPKRQTFASHHGTEQSSFQTVEPTPVKNNTDMQLDPSVIWSAQEGGVPENMLARPHTSNPRYVEKSQRDASPCTKSNVSVGFNFSPVSASSRNNNPTTNGGTTATLTNPSSNGPTPITTGRVHCPDDVASPCFADDGNSPQHHRVVYEEGPSVGVLWASDSYSVDPQLLARPVTSNPWLQRVFDSVEPLEGDGESPYETPVPALTKQRHSQILWSSADVNDWRMLARPHTSNPLLEQMDRGPGVEKSGKVQGTKILWRREETVEEMQEIIAAQETRIRHLESAVLQLRTQLSAQDGDHVDHMYIPRQPITPTDAGANKARKVSGAYFPETHDDGDNHQLLSDNLSGTGRPDIMNMDEASNVLSFESNETPSRILSQPSPIQEVEEDCPSPIQQVRPVSSCSQHQRAPVQLSDAETERFIRNNVTLAGGEDAVDEYNRMKKDLRNEARFKSTSQPHDDSSPADTIPFRPPSSRPESALPSRRAARLRQTVTQCRPNTAAASRRPVVATTEIAAPPTDKPSRPMSARPMTTSSWQSHPSHNVGEPVSLRAFLQNQANPCFTKLNAHPTLSATKAVGFLSDAAYAQEYAKLVRRGESHVLKDDFKELYLERAEEFGVTVSDREVERKMERFDSAGVDYLSPEEFAILYLKVAQW